MKTFLAWLIMIGFYLFLFWFLPYCDKGWSAVIAIHAALIFLAGVFWAGNHLIDRYYFHHH